MKRNQIQYSIRTVDNSNHILTINSTYDSPEAALYDNYNFDFPIVTDAGFRLNPSCIIYIRNISNN